MADTFNINEIEGEKIYLTPSIRDKDYAYSLLNSSTYNDEQKVSIDLELSDIGLEYDRFNEIVSNLKMNQSESPNPSMKEIKEQLNQRLLRDGDD